MRADVKTALLLAGAALAQGCLAQVDSAHQSGGSRAAVTEESGSDQDAEPVEPEPCEQAPLEARDVFLARCDECHRPVAERKEDGAWATHEMFTSEFGSIRSPSKMIEEGYIVPDSAEDSKLYRILELGLRHDAIDPDWFIYLTRDEMRSLHDWIACGAEDWPAPTL